MGECDPYLTVRGGNYANSVYFSNTTWRFMAVEMIAEAIKQATTAMAPRLEVLYTCDGCEVCVSLYDEKFDPSNLIEVKAQYPGVELDSFYRYMAIQVLNRCVQKISSVRSRGSQSNTSATDARTRVLALLLALANLRES